MQIIACHDVLAVHISGMENEDPVQALRSKAAKYRIPITAISRRAGLALRTIPTWGKFGALPSKRSLAAAQKALDELIQEQLA